MKLLQANPIPQINETIQFDDTPIVSVNCPERRGGIIREVRKMYFTPENLNKFWAQSRKYPTLFNEEFGGDFKKFAEIFLTQVGNSVTLNGLFWVIDDFVGVYYLTHIVPELDAQVHYSFFDGRQNGREELTKEMLSYVFNRYNFHRLTARIPCFAHDTTFRFVERVGFKYEGTTREGAFYKNQRFNVKQFGLLKEEHLNGNPS